MLVGAQDCATAISRTTSSSTKSSVAYPSILTGEKTNYLTPPYIIDSSCNKNICASNTLWTHGGIAHLKLEEYLLTPQFFVYRQQIDSGKSTITAETQRYVRPGYEILYDELLKRNEFRLADKLRESYSITENDAKLRVAMIKDMLILKYADVAFGSRVVQDHDFTNYD